MWYIKWIRLLRIGDYFRPGLNPTARFLPLDEIHHTQNKPWSQEPNAFASNQLTSPVPCEREADSDRPKRANSTTEQGHAQEVCYAMIAILGDVRALGAYWISIIDFLDRLEATLQSTTAK